MKILVDTYDEIYGKNLGKALALKDGFFIPLGKKETKDYEVVLSDKEEYFGDKSLIFLSHDPYGESENPWVYIYSGIEAIAGEIYNFYEGLTGKKLSRFPKGKSKMICLTSGSGGTGASSIAIALGRELAMSFQKTILYISFEKIPAVKIYIKDFGGKYTLNEYLYYCFKEGEKIGAPPNESFFIDDFSGLKVMRPSSFSNELLDLNQEEIKEFLSEHVNRAGFDFLILDIPCYLPGLNKEILNIFHKILLIDDGLALSKHKNQVWLDNFQPDEEKIIHLTNKWKTSMVEEGFLENEDIFFIEWDASSFEHSNDFVNINLNKSFGIGIRRIAHELASTL